MCKKNKESDHFFKRKVDRRDFINNVSKAALACSALTIPGCGVKEKTKLELKEFIKGHYTLMTKEERDETVRRLEKLYKIENGIDVQISSIDSRENVLFGYVFNISKCDGYMDCVEACVKENNLDRESKTQYVRIFENEIGQMDLHSANGKYFHKVPAEGHFYMGVQCYHCDDPPCIKVCPTKATWKEDDGLVVVDYDWCIGCRYCMAACPYFGRRFNWKKPVIPKDEINTEQHYLGNRLRKKGVVEKCTFCIQRTRIGKQPACAEACPTGARIFGNLLDPDSEIRYVLQNKKVFKLKEDLGTNPKFWYFMD